MANIKRVLIQIIIFMCAFTFFVSCTLERTKNDIQDLATAQAMLAELGGTPTPDYLYLVWPEPGEPLLLHDYSATQWFDFQGQGICVEFGIGAMLEEGDFLTQEELTPRFSLLIDDFLFDEPSHVLPRKTGGFDGPSDPDTGEPLFRVPPGSPYLICFARELMPGLHTATFSAQKTSGAEISYTWSFSLIDIAPTPTPSPIPFEPLPRSIEFTYPSPGAVVNFDEYIGEDGQGYYFGVNAPGICVSFLPYPFLLEPGDFLTSDDVLERLSLEVDGLTLTEVDFDQVDLATISGMPRVPDEPETGRPEASVPEGRYVVCFKVNLEPGMHSATFTAQKTSGEKIEYTWLFFLQGN